MKRGIRLAEQHPRGAVDYGGTGAYPRPGRSLARPQSRANAYLKLAEVDLACVSSDTGRASSQSKGSDSGMSRPMSLLSGSGARLPRPLAILADQDACHRAGRHRASPTAPDLTRLPTLGCVWPEPLCTAPTRAGGSLSGLVSGLAEQDRPGVAECGRRWRWYATCAAGAVERG